MEIYNNNSHKEQGKKAPVIHNQEAEFLADDLSSRDTNYQHHHYGR